MEVLTISRPRNVRLAVRQVEKTYVASCHTTQGEAVNAIAAREAEGISVVFSTNKDSVKAIRKGIISEEYNRALPRIEYQKMSEALHIICASLQAIKQRRPRP